MNIIVIPDGAGASTGVLEFQGLRFPCTLGRGGVVPPAKKIEGDGATPAGIYPLRVLFYRADRVEKPAATIPVEILEKNIGWCEDPAHKDYNKKVILKEGEVADHMHRDDHLYDITVVIGYNDAPVIPGKGSAIFMHLARPDFTPTAGCVGLRKDDLVTVANALTPATKIDIRLAP